MQPESPRKRPYCIGLTGGIGSGKSAAAAHFQALGAKVIDTDQIARALTSVGGAAIPAVRAAFGAEAIDATGAMHRAWMRARVFADAQARRELEAILHPMIRSEAERELAKASAAPYVVLVVPLLFETGAYAQLVDRTLVVDCPEALQVARVLARDGLDEATVRAIMASQCRREDRLARADDVIVNTGTLAELQRQVERLHERYRRLAQQSGVA